MTNLTDIRSSAISAAGAGLTVYATKEDLPSSGLTSGDQAYVTANSRLYVSNGSGWYNVALINATPSLSIDPTGTIVLSTTGETTTITLTATDSDNAVAGLTYSVESDGSFGGLASLSQDSSVFTITPLSEDSATTSSAVLTFKASDGINFGSGTRTLTLTFRTENSRYTTGLVKADASVVSSQGQIDASGEGHTINTGASSHSPTPYHPAGYSWYFGGNAYISVADDPGLDFGSSDFTMECWVYTPSPSTTAILMNKRANSGVYGAVYIGLVGGNAVASATSNGSSWDIISANTSFGAVSANTWTHIALVRNGNNFTGYVNGVGTSVATSSGTILDNTSAVNIGGETDGYQVTGYLRDVRWVKGTAVYTSNFTPPTAPLTAISGTELLLCNTPYYRDMSTNSHTLTTISGTVGSYRTWGPYDYITYNKADHGGSLRFNSSTNDYMTTDGAVANADFTLGTGDFTIEYWCFWTGTNVWVTVDFRTSQNQAYPALYRDGGTGALTYYVSGANKIVGSGTTGTIYVNVWTHIALVRNSGTTTLYKDGVSVGSFTDSTNYASGYWKWGRNENTWYFDGWASDMRLVKGTAVYTSNFTPPTAPLTAITNTKLLTATNRNAIWNTAGHTVRLLKYGNATASDTQRKFTTSSAMYFDGTGDYLQFDNTGLHDLTNEIFTIEGWFYWSSLTGEQTLLEKFTGGTGPGYTLYKLNSSNAIGFYSGATGTFSNSIGTVTSGQWHHVAITRDAAGTTRGFLDGSLNASGTYNVGNNGSTGLILGSRNGTANYFNGYMQDVRVTKGLARYTSAFTPPTAEFDG